LQGLKAIDFRMDRPAIQKAVRWLESTQQHSGGWGETPESYEDPSLKGKGAPTASQTAWATLGLIAAGHASGRAAQRGIDYLVRTQSSDGSWDEPQFTGTGFPRVFYLRYHLYCVYFPLMAMARYAACTDGRARHESPSPALACRIPAQPLSLEC
jgi:squalene-hopene/tetraprenyl-beta-curcumene cyclase